MRSILNQDCPGLLILSATGPDTAVKSVRATLYQPDVEAEFVLEMDDKIERLSVAAFSLLLRACSTNRASALAANSLRVERLTTSRVKGVRVGWPPHHPICWS